MRLAIRACACVLGLALLISVAHADTITSSDPTATFPFTGTGSQSSVVVHFRIAGDDFLYSLGTAEGPFVVAVCPDPGTACTFQQNYTAGVPTSDQFGMTAIFDGFESHATQGRCRSLAQ